MIAYVFKKINTSFFFWMMFVLASAVVGQSLEESDQEKNVENLDDLIAQATFGDKIEDRASYQVRNNFFYPYIEIHFACPLDSLFGTLGRFLWNQIFFH